MKRTVALTLVLLALAAPLWAAGQDERRPELPRDRGPYERGPAAPRIPNLGGTWYMSGDDNAPCEIRQRGSDGRSLFINEKGERAEGWVRGNRIQVPDWGGLEGKIRGDSIEWSNGTYWTR